MAGMSRDISLIILMTLLAAPVYSHTDIELQIAEATRQLEQHPGNADLLLRRGDLYRRHEDRDLALADFTQVRALEPGHSDIDWFEGRLLVETGSPEEGVSLLDRFLLANPGHSIALQNRAQGYLLLTRPKLAAQDYLTVIRLNDKPSPALYNAAAKALVKAGANHYPEAMHVIRQGLQQFPAEISLSGIGTDISLARGDSKTASSLIDQIPAPVQKLYQWQLRLALLNCQLGQNTGAGLWFSNESRTQSSTGNRETILTGATLTMLATEPGLDNCREAANEILRQQ
jgi:predicted Zn-dependent protease